MTIFLTVCVVSHRFHVARSFSIYWQEEALLPPTQAVEARKRA